MGLWPADPLLVSSAETVWLVLGKETALILILSYTGGVIFTILLAQLLNKVGFGATMRWTALVVGVLLVIANVSVVPPMELKNWAARRNMLSVAVFKQPSYLCFVGGSLLFFWGLFGPFNYGTFLCSPNKLKTRIILAPMQCLYSSRSLPHPKVSQLLTRLSPVLSTDPNMGPSGAAFIFGRILPPLYSDRIGYMRVIVVCLSFRSFRLGDLVAYQLSPLSRRAHLLHPILWLLFWGLHLPHNTMPRHSSRRPHT